MQTSCQCRVLPAQMLPAQQGALTHRGRMHAFFQGLCSCTGASGTENCCPAAQRGQASSTAWAHECSKSVSSVIGRASMSVLRATTGLPLPTVATTPVLAAGNLKHQGSYIINCDRGRSKASQRCKPRPALVYNAKLVQMLADGSTCVVLLIPETATRTCIT